MKICLINPTDNPRGEVFNLGYHLSKKGYEITIVYPTRNKRLKAEGDVKTIPFPAHFLPKIHYTIPNLRKEYQTISKLVREEKCDIIQTCDYEYLTSLPPIFIKKISPIILTIDAIVGTSWHFGDPFVDSVATLYTKTLGKFILNSYNELVVLSTKTFEDTLKLGIPKNKVRVIPAGVDFGQFSLNADESAIKSKLGIKDSEKVLLFVGRLALVKRIDILIELTKRLLKDGFNLKTIIVGNGEYRKEYEKLAMPLNKNIVFVGSVPHEAIHEYFAVADVFVLPSLSEGLPNVLLEAAGCSKPIVATNTGGIPDIIIHGETGFLAKSKDVDSFVHYTKLLLTDEDLSRRLGKNAYEHVKNNFTWDHVVREYEQLYLKMVDEYDL